MILIRYKIGLNESRDGASSEEQNISRETGGMYINAYSLEDRRDRGNMNENFKCIKGFCE